MFLHATAQYMREKSKKRYRVTHLRKGESRLDACDVCEGKLLHADMMDENNGWRLPTNKVTRNV